MSFTGKTAIVTGVAGGMGRGIAQALLDEGANVAGLDIADIEALKGEGEFLSYRGSVADWGFVHRSVSDAKDAFGRVDYVVNAAGVLWLHRDTSVVDIELDVWDQVMEINLKGSAHTIKAAVPLMKEHGGSIVHVSTIQCLRGDTKPQDAYQASKAGLIALSKSVAIQFATHGIRSNCILPGPTKTPMQSRWDDDPAQAVATAKAVPLGRVGSVADMTNACLFLLSDRASFITGTELIIDGGLTALP